MKTHITIDVEYYQNWFANDIRESLDRRFKLGEMLLTDILNSHLSARKVIAFIRAHWASKPAPSVTLFQTSLLMAQKLSDQQQALLLERCVPVDVVTAIVSGNYDGDGLRTRVISDINQGKIKHPWHRVIGSDCYKRTQAKKDAKKPHYAGNANHMHNTDSANNPDLVKIADHGVVSDELAINVLANVFSRLGRKERADKIVNEAMRKLGW